MFWAEALRDFSNVHTRIKLTPKSGDKINFPELSMLSNNTTHIVFRKINKSTIIKERGFLTALNTMEI